jgi:flavodoxin
MSAMFCFASCGKISDDVNGENKEDTIDTDTVNTEQSLILAVYFSCTGTTKRLAEYAADALGARLHEIVPETPYTSADLNYSDNACRANREQNNPSARPAIKNGVENMEKYDVILLGYPIWWGQAPKIIYTFLEAYDFSGKTIVPFCTSHSSGIGTSDANLHALAPNANWKSGKRFAGSESKNDILQWLESLNIPRAKSASSFNLSAGKNGKAPTVTLNSGYEMPTVGLGTYSLLGDVCVNSVVSALQKRDTPVLSGKRCCSVFSQFGNRNGSVVSPRRQRAYCRAVCRPGNCTDSPSPRQIARAGNFAVGFAERRGGHSRFKQSGAYQREHCAL